MTLVLISVLGGYLAGQRFEHAFDPVRLTLTLVAILLLASGSSALNQIQDREMDAAMPRTARRPLPSGRIGARDAWIFVTVTVLGGLALLAWLSPLQLGLGLAALISYNGLYTLWWKRSWAFAAVPGAVPGALPALMGHASAQGDHITPGGIYLFLVLFFWQMPHFWSLALRYKEDYRAGGVPTLPVSRGVEVTYAQITLWSLCYLGLSALAPLFFPVGWIYGIPTALMGAIVLRQLIRFSRDTTGKGWLPFFLWVNFSLIVYLAALVADLWHVFLVPSLTR